MGREPHDRFRWSNEERALPRLSMISKPMAGQILADIGADVIKVEPLGGDVLRYVAPDLKGPSSYFHHFNRSKRSKRSIAVDLKSPQGKHAISAIE